MSEETVEIVKRANAALNAHDVDGLFSLLHPDYEFVDHMGAVAEESGSGIETIRRQIEVIRAFRTSARRPRSTSTPMTALSASRIGVAPAREAA